MSNKNQHIISALQKLLNSSIIKDIYPMVDSIDIFDFDLNNEMMSVVITVNDLDMTYDNMYDKDFDPHYLIDYHLQHLLPYVGIKIPYVSWDVYRTDGKYVTGYERKKGKW